MDDPMDKQISRNLKRWAARRDPPANGRARLLMLAAADDRALVQSLPGEGMILPNTQNRQVFSIRSSNPPLDQAKLLAFAFAIAMKPWRQVTI